jgi:hypothetical protein
MEGLTGEFGLRLLASEIAPGAEPELIASPVKAVPDDLALPPQPQRQRSAPTEFLWWCSKLGPIQTLRDAPPSDDPGDHVAELLNREATDAWHDLIDLTRTPVIRYRRSMWHDNCRRRMQPGVLQGMAAPVSEQAGVNRLHARISRWMKRHGERLDPFDHCAEVPVERPSNTSRFLVWAWPEALSWVQAGGEVWPWTG